MGSKFFPLIVIPNFHMKVSFVEVNRVWKVIKCQGKMKAR